MKPASWPVRLAVVVWLGWLGPVGLLFAMLRLRVWHPHFLPVTGLLLMNPQFRKLAFRIAADDFSVVHAESVSKKGNTWRGEALYESPGGVPLLRSTRSEGRWDDGTDAKNVLAVVDRKFELIPDDEFTPERLLRDAPVLRTVRDQNQVEVSPLLTWCWLPLLLGAFSLSAGAALELLARKNPQAL